MTAQDHNKTLSIIYTVLGVYVTLPILAAPWVIISNISSFSSPRNGTHLLIATMAVLCVLLLLAVLLLSTALSLYRRKQRARRWALISAVAVFLLCPPVPVYTWWFMHSEGGKQLYADLPHV
jgi:cytochrome bd-type quinol oxidase subunit 1